MPFTTLRDSCQMYYKDWNKEGSPTVVFSHGWPLSSDDWASQMIFLGNHGCRVIAHDRRGHGRSDQTWDRNDMDNYTDDLHELIAHLDLKDIMMVGHSTGGGEVARYCGRHGTDRVRKAVLVAAIPPLMLKTDANPGGLPIEVFDSFRDAITQDRSQFFIDVPSGPFFNFNRPGAKVNQGMVWEWWRQAMTAGYKGTFDCVKVFSETDMTEDLKGMKIPVLLIHGDDDQICPIDDSARTGIKLLANGRLKEYKGGSHALHSVNVQEVNKDLLEFLNE